MGKRDPEREQRWRRTIEAWASSGKTAKQFCVDHGLAVNSFYTWRRELHRRDGEHASSEIERVPRERFVQLDVAPTSACIEIELSGAVMMRIPPSLDEQTLTKVIVALAKATAC